MSTQKTVIVTRHQGMVAWLERHGITGAVLSHVGPADVQGKIVVGVLPLHLAALAYEIVTVDMPLLKPEQRGVDLTPEEMDEAGATLHRYVVRKVDAYEM